MTVANLIFKNFLLKNEILLRLLLSLKAGIIGIQQKSDKYIRIYLAKINICFVCINTELKASQKMDNTDGDVGRCMNSLLKLVATIFLMYAIFLVIGHRVLSVQRLDTLGIRLNKAKGPLGAMRGRFIRVVRMAKYEVLG